MPLLDHFRNTTKRSLTSKGKRSEDGELLLGNPDQASLFARAGNTEAEGRRSADMASPRRLGAPPLIGALEDAVALELGHEGQHPEEHLRNAVARDRISSHIRDDEADSLSPPRVGF